MPQKTSWFSQYTLDYPNRDPDKISFYVVGWISIALLGMCMMFADIAAGVLLIVFFGLILTGIMLWKNPEVFNIKKKQNIPWMMSAYSLLYLSSVTFACFHWHDGQQRSLAMCIISAMLISLLLFYILYRWQRKASMEDSLKQLEMKQDQSFSSLQEKIEKSTEDLKQKLHPDIKYEDFDKWATIPDSVDWILNVLKEEFYYSKTELNKLSRDTIRINIQTRLKENHVEYKKANNAHFYRTIDIAAEMTPIFPQLPATTISAELNHIASPGNNLQRAKKLKVQRTSEDF